MVEQSRSSGARHVVMRELNRSLVLDLIKERSPISRAALAEASSLAKPTVSVIVEELLGRGIVREVGVGATTREGGRPPVLLEFDALSQCLAGVHVGVTTTTVVLADALGHEFHRVQMPTGRGKPERVFGRIVDAIREAVTTTGVTDRELAIGVCVPGLTESGSGICRLAPNLGWSDVPVRDLLGGVLDVPTYVHNSAQAAAVAETVEGAARGADDVVLLYLGSGVGSGWLTGGRLFPGATGLAGELGHCAVDGSTERCLCGRTGCLEAVASGIAIAREAKRAVAAGRATSLSGGRNGPTVEQVAEAAAAGDALSLELLSNAGRQLGIAASWLLNLTNPQVLVIAGGLTASGEPLLGPLRQAAEQHVLPQVRERCDIRMSQLGADAEVRGAVLLAMQYSETYYRVVFQGA
jgi:predicted NBD/HSP70 family sugar kinase